MLEVELSNDSSRKICYKVKDTNASINRLVGIVSAQLSWAS